MDTKLVYMPWGKYEILLDSITCKVKRITINPAQRLSYQYHLKRQEQWTVIEGDLTIVLDDRIHTRGRGQSIHIPRGARHRAWNETNDDVVFIEVQSYDAVKHFGEDDIVRISDDYGRSELP